jgi:uncharacterized protein YchJ
MRGVAQSTVEVQPCRPNIPSTSYTAFERSSKRRRGFPSEVHVKRGQRIVHTNKDLIEKVGRNDPCPCGSGRRFQEMLYAHRPI